MDNVHYSSSDRIGEIILQRGKHNPLDLETLQQLISAFERSAEQDKCVLFKASGPNFTVGADIKYMHQLAGDTSGFSAFSAAFQQLTRVMLGHPGIIIIGLHGWVVGGGFEISLSADLRFASPDTRIKLPELSLGTMFSNASTKLLPQIVGMGRAKEVMLLGQELSADRALQIGLYNRLCDDLDAEMQATAELIAREIDGKALQLAKRLIHDNAEATIEETLHRELEVMEELSDHPAFLDTIRSFSEK